METQTAEGRPFNAIAAQDRPISRVRIAAAAFCMQLTFGAVYGWSVFLNPLREQFGAGKSGMILA
jgi:OFA family oxalate/formate antiporter-like MFS transporter